MPKPLLEVRNLCKSFGGVTATDHLDLSLQPGFIHAVIGPNGAGKTTMIAQLSGALRPDSGKILFDGRDITSLSSPARSHLGIARTFQITSIFHEFTALENTEMPLRLARVALDEARPRAEELLHRVGLGERLDHRPGMLSGGEQQRVALARALIMRPTVLLADAPTGDLDEATALSLHELLREMHREHQLTSVIATHNLRLASSCDRVMKLAEGHLSLQS